MNLSSKLKDEEKMAKIREYKEKGNAAHKIGDFKKAMGSYHRALLYIKGLSANSPDISDMLGMPASGGSGKAMPSEMQEESDKLTCDCYNNLAACMLKEEDPKYDRIVEHCDKALEVSPSNDKALFRKGISLYHLGLLEEALAVLEKVNMPGAEVKRYIGLCKKGVKEQEKDLASLYKGMFKS